MSNNNQQLFNRIDAILDGIDRQEDGPKGGWWHTEDGARVGRIRLWELKEAIQEHLITVAGTACAGAAKPEPIPVDLAALHDPDFSDGLSPIEHLNRLSGVAPTPAPLPTGKSAGRRLPIHKSCPANGCSVCRDHLPCARLERLKQVAPAPVLPKPSTRDDLDSLCGPPTLKDVEAASAQPAALAQPAEGPGPVALGRSGLTPDEIEASFRDWWKDRHGSAYFGAVPLSAVIEWTQFALARHGCPPLQEPDHASLIAFAHGREPWATWLKPGGCLESAHCELGDLMMAVLARHARPAFHPVPVSERLPGPEDCTPWRDDPTAQPWCWAAKDVDGWEWIQLSMGHLHGNPGGIMPGHGYTHWAPWWALPLPGGHSSGATEEAWEGQPCSP
jgi:hypothetical protein